MKGGELRSDYKLMGVSPFQARAAVSATLQLRLGQKEWG